MAKQLKQKKPFFYSFSVVYNVTMHLLFADNPWKVWIAPKNRASFQSVKRHDKQWSERERDTHTHTHTGRQRNWEGDRGRDGEKGGKEWEIER